MTIGNGHFWNRMKILFLMIILIMSAAMLTACRGAGTQTEKTRTDSSAVAESDKVSVSCSQDRLIIIQRSAPCDARDHKSSDLFYICRVGYIEHGQLESCRPSGILVGFISHSEKPAISIWVQIG